MMKDKYRGKLCQQFNLLDHVWSKPHLDNYAGIEVILKLCLFLWLRIMNNCVKVNLLE